MSQSPYRAGSSVSSSPVSSELRIRARIREVEAGIRFRARMRAGLRSPEMVDAFRTVLPETIREIEAADSRTARGIKNAEAAARATAKRREGWV